MISKENNKVVRTKLGYYRINPLPPEEELRKYYKDKYYTSVKTGIYRTEDSDEMAQVSRMNSWAADNFLRYHPKQRASGLLDIGCGPGYLMAAMYKRGVTVSGLDPYPEIAVFYNPEIGPMVKQGIWQDLETVKAITYDWVNLGSVLEHVRDPSGILQTVRDILEKNGVVRIEVPNDFSLFQLAAEKSGRIKRRFWVAPPDHLNYFDKTSLQKLVETNGFKIVYNHTDFPIDIFLLFGRNYTDDPELVKQCHQERLKFEETLSDVELKKLYEHLYTIGVGRNLIVYAIKS